MACAAWNCSMACFQPKLCRMATPRRKWRCASLRTRGRRKVDRPDLGELRGGGRREQERDDQIDGSLHGIPRSRTA